MKCGVWRVQCEVWGVKSAVWSVKLWVWRKQWGVRSVKCGLWSVKCGLWSVKFGVRRVQCDVWSVECDVWSVKCGVLRVQCEVWSVKCGVWRLQWEVGRAKWSFTCDMWSRTQLSQSARTHGLGWRTAHASSIDEKGLIYIFKATSAPPRAGTTGIISFIYIQQKIYNVIVGSAMHPKDMKVIGEIPTISWESKIFKREPEYWAVHSAYLGLHSGYHANLDTNIHRVCSLATGGVLTKKDKPPSIL